MNRTTAMLAGLGAIVMLALFWFLGYQPQQSEIDELDVAAADLQDDQRVAQGEIARLETVRVQIPQIEAAIEAAESIVPRSPALPSTLRQLVLAADSSGVVIESITPTRPERAEALDPTLPFPPDLATIGMSMQLSGGYFQIVDFLRRIEDPALIARGIVWSALDVNVDGDDYPVLNVILSGQMYAILPDAEVEELPTDDPTPGETETPTDGETAEAAGEVTS